MHYNLIMHHYIVCFFERKKLCSPYMIMIIYILRNNCLYDYTSCDNFLIIITNYVWFTVLTWIKRNEMLNIT